ncbi:MAG: hypothetical protein AAGL49_10275, partial [Pseudomonadota bacterium]
YALPFSIFLLGALTYGLARTAWTTPRNPYLEEMGVIVSVCVLGMALYVLWQSGQSLEPGKNSQVKFIYTAYVAPFMMVPIFSIGFGPRARTALGAAILVLFALAAPLSIYRW